MEQKHGYVANEVVADIQSGKQSEASATYWLMRLRELRTPATQAQPLSARTTSGRPVSGALAGREPSPRGNAGYLSAREAATNKENVGVVQSPLAAKVGKAVHGETPTKKLTRSPKPLTLLQAYADGRVDGAEEVRRSSPGLFGAPVGAAHAAARHRQQQQQQQQPPPYGIAGDALSTFRERMRGAEGGSTRPASARGRRATGSTQAPRPPNAGHQQRPPSRSVSPRHTQRGITRDLSPRDVSPRDAQPAGPPLAARRGADFRQRKYGQPQQGNARIAALISAR